MPRIRIKTTVSEIELEPTRAESLTLRIGEKEQMVEGASNILATFETFLAAINETQQSWQDTQDDVDDIEDMRECHRQLNRAFRRCAIGS